MVATDKGFDVVNASIGGGELLVFQLSSKCSVVGVAQYDGAPRDVEDLAQTSDGNLWAADVGDPDLSRPTAAVWFLNPDADPILFRLEYPDGPHDAAALLVTSDATPVIVTKSSNGVAGLYVPTEQLTGGARTVSLRSAGTLTIKHSGTTGGPPGGQSNQVEVTGGAVSPDGKKVVLRTYTDAYEWDISSKGIASTLTSSQPRRTALAGEPRGEAISYNRDGSKFLTASKERGSPIHEWTPAKPGAAKPSGKPDKAGAAAFR